MDQTTLKQQLDEYFDAHANEMLDSICRLIRIRSDRTDPKPGMPYGEGPAAVLKEAIQIADELGFSTRNYDNHVAAVDFNNREKQLDILSHLDCVPVGDDWTVTAPFEPIIRDGRLYGRGAVDDKGPSMCALYAMKAIRDLGVPLSKNVRLIMGADEECGGEDVEYYYSLEQEAPNTFSPDADYPLINIEKGSLGGHITASWEKTDVLPRVSSMKSGTRTNVIPDAASATVLGLTPDDIAGTLARFEQETGVSFTAEAVDGGVLISAMGRSGHASTPENGNNGLTALIGLLAALSLAPSKIRDAILALAKLFPHGDYHGAALGVDLQDEESGRLTLSLDLMDLNDTGLSTFFDSRAPLCANDENLTQTAREALAKEGLTMDANDRMGPPHYVPADSPFIQTLLGCYELYTGEKGKPIAIGGGTYVHSLENGVAFGIMHEGTDYHMHGADEFAIVDELIMSAKIFASSIVALCA